MPKPKRPMMASINFTVISPDDTVQTPVDSANQILISVQVTSQGAQHFVNAIKVKIFDISVSPPVQIGSETSLPQTNPITLTYSAPMDMGSGLPVSTSVANRRALVKALNSGGVIESGNYDFEAISLGSGSGSEDEKTKSCCEFCPEDEPVPVVVRLALADAGASIGSASPEGLPLVHRQDKGHECSWLSAAVEIDGGPGFWQLRKTEACTWTLALKIAAEEIVGYRATTKVKACSFPITLERTGGCAPEGWPKVVKIAQYR